uniref:Uncharacterized protein n=1 Tax=Cannabis sativa TaxID=3483 RepID=A0A803R1M3_CANSA
MNELLLPLIFFFEMKPQFILSQILTINVYNNQKFVYIINVSIYLALKLDFNLLISSFHSLFVSCIYISLCFMYK